MLINKKHVRDFALALAAKRARKFERISAGFLERADFHMQEWIKREVDSHPSVGITIK